MTWVLFSNKTPYRKISWLAVLTMQDRIIRRYLILTRSSCRYIYRSFSSIMDILFVILILWNDRERGCAWYRSPCYHRWYDIFAAYISIWFHIFVVISTPQVDYTGKGIRMLACLIICLTYAEQFMAKYIECFVFNFTTKNYDITITKLKINALCALYLLM